ncbi:MAG: exonuclease SbcC, partial [Planctomycetota bacterium]
MRILAIRGRNLASLARAFSIDLAKGELASAGLFAITGPVGAGKSTLLDALCLALFDRTPRLTGRGGTLIGDVGQERGDWLRANDPRTLLRRNAVDGHAEVDFIGRDGVPYRSRWSVRRARRRIDGRLQDQELILHDLRQNIVVASGRRSIVLQAIKQRLGLDFSQFCRSVLLAQGEFHAFLHAAADERAKLLETLTGAQLYRRLSKRAHEKRREQDTVVNSLRSQFDGCQVLAGDARKKLEADADGLARQLEVCDVGITIAQSYVLWHQDAERRREQEEKAMVALREAVATNAAANARREQLQTRQRAMAAVPRWEVAREALEKAKATADEVRKAEAQHVARAQQVAAAKLQWTELVPSQFGLLETVPGIVRDLPQWLPSLQRWHDTEQQVATADRKLLELRDAVTLAERAVQTKQQSGAKLVQRVADADGAVTVAEQAVGEADYDQVAARRRELAAQQAELIKAATALQQWHGAVSAVDLARDSLAVSTAESGELEPRRGGCNKRLAQTTGELAKVREQVRIAEQQQGLEALRARLVDGEACPLCGSEEHDVHGDELPDLAQVRELLQQAEVSHEQAQRDAAHEESNWQRMQRELAARQDNLKATEVLLATTKMAFEEFAPDAGEKCSPALA